MNIYYNQLRIRNAEKKDCEQLARWWNDGKVIRGTKAGFTRSGKYYRPQKLERGNFYQIPSSTSLGNVMFIEACRSYQVNKEIVEKGKHYGALSYYINQVLSKKAALGLFLFSECKGKQIK